MRNNMFAVVVNAANGVVRTVETGEVIGHVSEGLDDLVSVHLSAHGGEVYVQHTEETRPASGYIVHRYAVEVVN